MTARRYILVAAFLLSCLLGITAAADAAHKDNEGGYHPAVPADVFDRLPFQGNNRKYLVHLPAHYDGSTPKPLVVVIHGGGGDIGFAVRMFEFNQKADREDFIVAYPNGSGRLGDYILTWNSGACCGYAKAKQKDDVGFMREFLKKLKADYNIDSQRVYVLGFSNGGMMAYKFASEMPEEFAAFAAISGSMHGREKSPAMPVPGLIIHGTADRHIPVTGGGGKLAKWGFNVHAKPLQYAVDFWASANGCTQLATHKENGGQVTCQKYHGGKDGAEVIVYTIDGYKHSWPGGNRAWFRADPPYPGLSATDKCWEFFSRHKRQSLSEQVCHQPLQSPGPCSAPSVATLSK